MTVTSASRWAEIEAQLEADTQAQFAEHVRVEPMAGARYSDAALDPGRPVIECAAILEIPTPYSAEIAGLEARVAYDEAKLELPRSGLPEGWDVQPDDLVTALERPEEPRWTVQRVDATHRQHVILILAPIA